MDNYSFCKKDGSVKKRYKFACHQIVSSQIKHHEITKGRYDDIVEEYDSYTIPRIELYSPKKYSYISKVQEICKNFSVSTKEWYSCNDVSIDLLGDNVSEMIKEIEKLLGGDIHIR